MAKIGANPTKYQFDNYYKLIRTYFKLFSKHSTIELDTEIYIIRNNTVFSTIDNLSIINGYICVQLRSTHGGYLLKVCECNLIEISMIHKILKNKFGKVVTIFN